MSNVVDQRILQMQFDNKQFEQGVGVSLKTLEDLKKGLNLDKASKSLDSLQKAGRSFSLEGMASNIDSVAKKFTAMGIVGITCLSRISNAAFTAGKNLVTAFTIDPITAGLKEYETQIGSIQTILSNTKSKGSTLDDVNKSLDELNTYADKTIYNFTEMAKNIGTFTAAGVGLETSTKAIKGIANLAAVSGSNAQQASVAMYQLSQALASGTVKLMDWNSVVNAGMGGEVFQNALKDTARIHGIAIDAMVKKEGSFRETLKNGWLTASILTETLSKFTGDLTKEEIVAMGYTEDQAKSILELGKDASDAATKVKTFTQLMDTLKEALGSGWTQTWENIIGNFEEARDLWTGISDILGNLINQNAKARNDLLAAWKEQGGRADLLQGLKDIFDSLFSVITAIGQSMREIFPETTVKDLLNMSKAVKGFGKNLKAVLYYTQYAQDRGGIIGTVTGGSGNGKSSNLKLGSKGDEVKKLQEQLKAEGKYNGKIDGIFGKGTEAALKQYQKEKNLVADGIFGSKTQEAMDGTAKAFQRIIDYTYEFSPKLEQIQKMSAGFFAIVDIGIKSLKFLGDVFLTVADTLSPIADIFWTLGAALGDWFVSIDDNLKKTEPFTNWLDKVRNFLAPIKTALENAKNAFLNFFGFGEKTDEANGKLETFVTWWGKIKQKVDETGIWDKVTAAFDRIKAAFDTIAPKLKEFYEQVKSYIGDKFSKLFQSASDALPSFIETVGNLVVQVIDWLEPYIAKIPGIVEAIKNFLFGTEIHDSRFSSSARTPGFIERAKNFFKSIYDLLSQNEKIKSVVEKLKTFFKGFWETLKEIFGGDQGGTSGTGTDIAEKKVDKLQTFIDQYMGIWDKFSTFLSDAFENADAFLKKVGTGGIIGVLIAAIGALSIASFLKTAKRVMHGIGDVIDIFKSKFKVPKKIQPVSKSILQIAVAIGILVASIYILGTMDSNAFKRGIIALGSLLLFMTALTIFITKGVKLDQASSMEKVGKGLLDVAIAIGILVVAIYLLGNMDPTVIGQGGAALAAIMLALGVFLAYMKTMGSTNVDYKGLVGMAFAIGILGLIAYMLGKMNGNQLFKGMIALGGLMTMLALFMAFVNHYGGTGTVQYKGLFSMVFAVGLMAGLVVLLSKVDWTKGWQGVVALGLMMAMLGAFMIVVNHSGGTGTTKYAGLIALAAAVGILAGIAVILGGMQTGAMWQGVSGLSVILLALGVFMKLLGEAGESLKWSTVAQTVILVLAIAALVAAFGYVMTMIKDVDPDVMTSFAIAFATSIGTLVAAIIVITKLKVGFGAMAKGAASIGTAIAILIGILTGIVWGLGRINEITNGGFVATINNGALVLRAVGKAIGSLVSGIREGVLGTKDLDKTKTEFDTYNQNLDDLKAAMESFRDILLGLMAACAISGIVGQGMAAAKGALGMAAALFILTAAVAFLVWALGGINQITNNGFIETIQDGAGVMKALGEAIASLVTGIKSGFNGQKELEEKTATVTAYSTALTELNTAVKEMGANDTLDDDIAKAISITQKLHDFFDDMSSYPVNFWALESYETAPSQISTDMGKFAEAISTFVEKTKNLGNPVELLLSTMKAIGIAALLHNFFSNIETYKITKVDWGSYITAPDQLSQDMEKFGTAIQTFVDKIEGFTDKTTVENDAKIAIAIATAVHDFFSNVSAEMPDGTGIQAYTDKLETLFQATQDFADTMSEFGTKISKISQTTIVADTLSALASAAAISLFLSGLSLLPLDGSKGHVDEWLNGPSKTDSVIDQLATLGESMGTLKDKINGFSESTIVSDTESMKLAAQAIVGLLSWITANGDVLKGYAPENGNMDIFTAAMEQLRQLGGAMSEFSSTTGTVDATSMLNLASAFSTMVKAMTDLTNVLNGQGDKKLDSRKFLEGLDSKAIIEGLTNFTTTVGTTMASSKETISSYVEQFNNAGTGLATAMNNGVNASNTDTSGISNMCQAFLSTATNYYSKFYNAGYNLGTGMAKGVRDSKAYAVLYAQELAEAALKKIREVFKERSPSKATEEIGKYAVMGLANGFRNYGNLVAKSAENVSNDALDSTQSILSNLSGILASNVDSDPVIRPVVDLSNVTASARTIGGLLSSSQSIAIGSARSKMMAHSVNMKTPVKDQNGSASGANPIVNNNNRVISFEGANFVLKDNIDIRAFKLQLDALERDDQRAHGSVY